MRIAKLSVLCLLCGLSLAAAAAGARAAEGTARKRVLMDAGWRFYRGDVAGEKATASGMAVTQWRWIESGATAPDAAETARIADPALDTGGGEWRDAKSGDDVFHGRGGFAWFRTILPNAPGPERVLHFETVDDNGTVYLNGKLLLRHTGWDEPFDVDLKSAWNPAGSNVLTVLVENIKGAGGITAPVWIQNGDALSAPAPARPGYGDRSWRTVHLPHDFIIEGTFSPEADASHGSLPTTTAWYRKTFRLPASDRGKSLWIDFDGVYRDSRVWLNGHYLGRHQSGYTSFRYDITKAARYGGDNVLAVYVDPRRTEGWWYEGGGIYRHVWLNVADPVHVAPWGTFVTATLPEPAGGAQPDNADVTIKTTVANDAAEGTSPINAAIVSQVVDDAGQKITSASLSVGVPAGRGAEATMLVRVPRPHLWSLETPYLYKIVTTVQVGGKDVDLTETPFGIRTLRWDANTGFYLNGKSVKIKGTCNHQDFIGVGVGMPDSLLEWRIKKLKEMGDNGYRMSHNPPAPELLAACDRLGMLVMDENRHLGDSPEILGQVADMVQRDRNHPSIVMWSMCNEQPQAATAEGGRIFKAMMDTVRKYDTSRPVSSAMNSGWFGDGFTGVEDLMGVNYHTEVYDRFHNEHPTIPMFGSETASTLTTRGEYANDATRVFVTSYRMTDFAWRPVAERPFMAGSFAWTGFDYKGEPTPYKWPCVNSHFGIMDMCGFPKDNYYYYQAWWRPEPIVHLLPHWNWPGKEGQIVQVIAFSNCERVELFLNGASQGAKVMPRNGHLAWNVLYAPGALTAKGYNGDAVAATDKVETTAAPASLRLRTDRVRLTADGEDVTMVEVAVLDAQGRVVPTADNLVSFTVQGAGVVAGVGNGNPGDHDPDRGSRRHAFNGLCMALVGATEKPGKIRLTAASPGLQGAELDLASDSGVVK